MTSNEIRNQFLEFFKKKGHKITQSAPVVPYDDPTLLFTNAGMNQFKDVFLGMGMRDYKRCANTQKCIRVSGKHNDLEEVGYDTYHHTFFEMLGNWSFGDYYKEEAIKWGWELLTEVWKLPKERLWATVFRTDDEAYDIWLKQTDIARDHILRFDEKDNFWEMGEVGPCGPCSEIHINVSDDYNNPKLVNAGSPECIEIWNLVFIQYNRDLSGVLTELPAKHVDTGMGFERICAVLQNKKSNYDTDIFTPIINNIAELSGVKYETEENKISIRVIADHLRMLSFAIADGAAPGNEGRGYVLRRILRRASRYGRKLNLKTPFMHLLVAPLAEQFKNVFPELTVKREIIEKIILSEEESFNHTLDRGIEIFERFAEKAESQKDKSISGEDAFMLYDTYGFPFDLTEVMAKEKKLKVDEKKFQELMNEQKKRARESNKEKFASVAASINDLSEFGLEESAKTEFVGYENFSVKAKIIGHKKEKGIDYIALDRTPFYVESGGQIDDIGSLIIDGIKFPVIDLIKIGDKIIHIIENPEGIEIKSKEAEARIDEERRWDIMRNHSATHLLHSALRNVLGSHVQQAGSLVTPDKLRFDFSHFAKLSEEEIEKIESLVNTNIRKSIPLSHHKEMSFEAAKQKGALMFFGDKYGEKVNVVQFGDFSMEFCGGSHVSNTSQIGLFKIISESSISSGVRRIEATTGAGVEKYIKRVEDSVKDLKRKIEELIEEKKKLEKEINEISLKEKLKAAADIIKTPIVLKGINVYKGKVGASTMDELKSFGDEIRMKTKNSISALFAEIEGKAAIVCTVSDDLIKEKKLSAGKIVGEIAKLVGGGGGGRPHLASAGGKDVNKIDEAINKTEEIIKQIIG